VIIRVTDGGNALKSDEQYRGRAREMYQEEGRVEVDAEARVSASNDGAYVQAWVWVPSEELGPSTAPNQPRLRSPAGSVARSR
jgi:hypothetical protein